MQTPGPTVEELQNALAKTGFLFEQQALQFIKRQMEAAGLDTTLSIEPCFDAEPNYLYNDAQTEKSRELDIYGHFSDVAGDPKMGGPYFNGHLIVECKSGETPFAVIGSGANSGFDSDWSNSLQVINDPLSYWSGEPYSIEYAAQLRKAQPGPFAEGFRGTQLVRLSRAQGSWKADNSGVHDSILYPLAKATTAIMKYRTEINEADPEPELNFYFPILLTNAPVYKVVVHEENVDIREVGWTALTREFSEQGLKGKFPFEVVNYGHLGEYLRSRFLANLADVKKRLIENGRYFSPHWCAANLGAPKDEDGYNKWVAYFDQYN